MFNKLKRRFVIINMSLLTLVFAGIFGTIFFLTAVSGERQTDFALNAMMNTPPRPSPKNPMAASSIIVELDSNNDIVEVHAFWQIDQETLADAVTTVMAEEKEKTKIKIGDTYFASLRRSESTGTRIVFVDRTPQQETLSALLMIFITTGGISLGILLVISLFLAARTVKPIKEAFDKQQQFIADASHELKTPLTIVKTNLSLLKSNENETVKSQAKWIGFISDQTDRLSKLVEDLLSLTRLDFNDQKMEFVEFNISHTIEGELLSFEAAAFENHLTLNSQVQPDLKYTGNKESIKRLFNILMDNAVKNTPQGGEVLVLLENKKGILELSVKNTGEGISQDHLEKIFERFYRVDTARARESGGYGLGLAIAKSIARAHHGRIYANSNLGTDSTFIVELPHSNEKQMTNG